jgi:hypothetical protein
LLTKPRYYSIKKLEKLDTIHVTPHETFELVLFGTPFALEFFSFLTHASMIFSAPRCLSSCKRLATDVTLAV